jgi:ankyrin repeat protein
MNEENLTPLIKALLLWPPSKEDDIHDVIEREDINELCYKDETFPYLYLINIGQSAYLRSLRDNPKFNLNNTNKYGETVLMALAKQGEYEDTRILIERGADWKMKDNKGMTAMDYAREYGFEEDPKILGINEDGEVQYRELKLFRYYQHLSGTLDPLYAKNHPF